MYQLRFDSRNGLWIFFFFKERDLFITGNQVLPKVLEKLGWRHPAGLREINTILYQKRHSFGHNLNSWP